MGAKPVEEMIDDTEKWFVHNGIPHFIDDFSASEDVWTRAVGVLSFVFFAEMFLTFGDQFTGVQQALVFLGGIAVALAAFVLVNRMRGRPSFSRPRTIGVGELALFVLVPPVLALLGGNRGLAEVVQVVIVNLIILALVYVAFSWGLLSMLRWGIATMLHHVTRILQLLGKVLPLMLLFSAFLFLNAEIWQVVNDLPLVFFAIVVGALALIGFVFLAGSMTGAISELRYFDSWDEVAGRLTDTPLDGCDTNDFDGTPAQVPLGRAARSNLTLRLVVGLSAQVLLVTGVIFGFYVLFGVLTVREATILQWTTLEDPASVMSVTLGSLTVGGERIVLSALHLVTAGIVASFSGLQFAVSLVTDENYRAEFVEESNDEVREALAVRAAYLNLVKSAA